MQTAVREDIDVEFAEPGDPASAGALTVLAAPTYVAPVGGGFLPLIEKAVDKGDLTLVREMMALQKEWEANEARKAFNHALAAAKAEIRPVVRNRQVKFEAKNVGGASVDYMHEDLAGIAQAVDEILARNGLFYTWEPTNNFESGAVSVTCNLTHALGHTQKVTLHGKIDTSGQKNHLQAIQSAVTYLERQTLKSSLGLSSKHDDDGRASGAPVRVTGAATVRDQGAADDTGELLSKRQISDLQDLIVDRGVNIAPFLGWVRKSAPNVKALGDIPACFFDDCVASIKRQFPLAGEK
jgi:ERF superfamily